MRPRFLQDDSVNHTRYHQDEQPRYALFSQLEKACFGTVFRWRDGRHLSEVLGCFVLQDIDCVVNGDDADEPVFLIDDGIDKKS